MNRGGFGRGGMNNPNNSAENKKLDGKTTRSIILRLFGYIMKYWYLFLIALVFTFVSNWLSLMGPEYSGNAIDAIANENGVQFGVVWENVKMS